MLARFHDLNVRDFGHLFSSINALSGEMNRMLREFEGLPTGKSGELSPSKLQPRTKVYDQGKSLVLVSQTPGFMQENLQISANAKSLTITGEKQSENLEGYAVLRKERSTRRFSRSFTFPCPVDPDKITAKLKDGLLTIKIEKAAEAQPRQIQIQ